MAGFEIPGYEILEKIGEGGMAVVYKARQLSLGRLVAIKILRPNLAEDPVSVAQFKLEANSVATLKHPNIVQIHEAGEFSGTYFFVMEYVAGYSVGRWLNRKGLLTEENALLVANPVAKALEYAWSKSGLIHCDIKPDNIMVDEDGTIKLSDFSGLSFSRKSPEAETLAEVVIGTPNYMAPEQARGVAGLDFRADIYALGAVLYHLISGILPFKDTPEMEAAKRHISDFLEDPRKMNPEVSEGMALLIQKMMVKNRGDRYANWGLVIADIARVKEGKLPLGPWPDLYASTVVLKTAPVPPEQVRTPPAEPSWPESQPVAKREVEKGREPVGIEAEFTGRFESRSSVSSQVVVVFSVLVILGLLLAVRFNIPQKLFHPDRAALESGVTGSVASVESAAVEPPETVPSPESEQAAVQPVEPGAGAPATTQAVVQATDTAEAEAEKKAALQIRAAGLNDYLGLMEKVIGLSQRRNYSAARKLVEAWRSANPGHAYREQADLEIERLEKATDLFAGIEKGSALVRGMGFQIPGNMTGTISKVAGGMVILERKIGGAAAQISMELLKLPDADLAKLLWKTDEPNYPLNMAVLQISESLFSKADAMLEKAGKSGLDIASLRAWSDDWQKAILNNRANRALDELIKLADKERFAEAGVRLRQLRDTFAASDILEWARKEEFDLVSFAIEDATTLAAATTGPAPEEVEEADPFASLAVQENPSAEETKTEPAETAEPEEAGEIEQITISELKEQIVSLNGRTVKLRFKYRGDIRQVSEGSYATQLGEDGSMIGVEFPQDGYKWMRNVPLWGPTTKKWVVFGKVEAPKGCVVLIGRTRSLPMGNKAAEFSW